MTVLYQAVASDTRQVYTYSGAYPGTGTATNVIVVAGMGPGVASASAQDSGIWSKNGTLGSDEVQPSEIAPGAGISFQCATDGQPLTVSANLTAGNGIQLDTSGGPIAISVSKLKTNRDSSLDTYYEYEGYAEIAPVAYTEYDIILPQTEWLPPGTVTSDSAHWGHTAYIEIEIVGTDGASVRFRKLYWAMLRRGSSGYNSWEMDSSPQEDTAQARGTMSGGLIVTLDRNGENDADLTFGFIYEYADVGGNESPKGTWTVKIRILGAGRYE
jgi:hypothetical protein